MERLTKKDPCGLWITTECDEHYDEQPDGTCKVFCCGEAIDRLAAYEDTGLTPTEIVHADKMLKDNWEMPLERLKEAIDLINTKDDGRLAVSRFKHGDCVWVIERNEDGEALDVAGSMFLAEVLGFVIVSAYINDMTEAEETLSYHMQETAENYDTTLMVFPSEDVYQTKAEAETALREAAENA